MNKRFIFIVGTPGSGTTLVLKLLSHLPNAIGLGGNYQTVQHQNLVDLNEITLNLWDTSVPKRECYKKELKAKIEQIMRYYDKELFVYKRSCPFASVDRFSPSLHDITQIPNSSIIWVSRSMLASTWSFSRDESLLEERFNLTAKYRDILGSEYATITNPKLYLPFEHFVSDINNALEILSDFVGVEESILREEYKKLGIKSWKVNEYEKQVSDEGLKLLNRLHNRYLEQNVH